MRTILLVCSAALLAGTIVCPFDSAGAQGSPEAQQACTPDAMRLCADVIPDVAKITACMNAKFSQLSEQCRAVMRGGGHTARHHGYRHCRHNCG
jgi:hypothetical protein